MGHWHEEPCDARAVQRRTTSGSENAGTARQGQQGPERGSGRPAGHALALQIDGSHRLHSQRSLVRGKEEAWSGPLAGSGTGLQVSSLARASAVHRQPGRQPGGPRIAPGKVPEQQQATRVRPQSARKEHNTAGDGAGFQVSATRSERASDPGSGPGLAVACTQHRVRAAAGCTHSGRPTGTGTRQGHRSSGAPRIKFHGAGIPDPRGSGPRGGDTSGHNSERSCATDISHDGSPPEQRPRGCQISALSQARNTAGGCEPAGRRARRYCFMFICQRQRPPKKGGAGLNL